MTTNSSELLNCIESNPVGSAKHTIIWLHGLGADGNDFAPIVPELKLPSELGVRFIFPHAPIMPITINSGYEMRAWFDIYDLSTLAKIDTTGIASSVKLIEHLITREEERGITTDNIILAGFSQGAVMALITGLSYAKHLAGILALSGFLPHPEQVMNAASEANRHIPIFIAHGTEDAIVPYALGETSAEVLRLAGYPTTWRSYPMPHAVCPEEIQDISTWIKQRFNQK